MPGRWIRKLSLAFNGLSSRQLTFYDEIWVQALSSLMKTAPELQD